MITHGFPSHYGIEFMGDPYQNKSKNSKSQKSLPWPTPLSNPYKTYQIRFVKWKFDFS